MIKPLINSEWIGKEVSHEICNGYYVDGKIIDVDEEEIKGLVDWIDEGYQSWEWLCDLDIKISNNDKFLKIIESILNKLKYSNKSYISNLVGYNAYHINHINGGFQSISYDEFRYLCENKLIRFVGKEGEHEFLYKITYKGLNYV